LNLDLDNVAALNHIIILYIYMKIITWNEMMTSILLTKEKHFAN